MNRFSMKRVLFAAGVVVAGVLSSAWADDVDPVTARVDHLMADRWIAERVEPAEPADDSEFLRRACLDIVGVIPTAFEAREFLADQSADKRAKLIDRLVASPAHATHLADVWRHLMLPGQFDPQQAAGVIGLQNWLRQQFADGRRYDRIVADLLVATGGDESGPALFYTALQLKPEALGAATARIFLGLRLDCAECHDHPFDHWKQQDFWGYAAFFSQVQRRNLAAMRLVDAAAGEVKLPNTDQVVAPRYLSGPLVDPNEPGTRRQQLAIWMVSRDNPFLARAAVNIVWAQLFGRGLVEPLDDFGPHNPPSHPELLEELAVALREHQYDLGWLFKALAKTRAYGLSSSSKSARPAAAHLFAQMAVKTLTPEQFYDSLSRASLKPLTSSQDRLADGARQQFLIKMQTQTPSATDFEMNVPQALALMNGEELNQAADAANSRLVAALEAPFMNDAQRIEALFLATLARVPRGGEGSSYLEILSAAPTAERPAVLGDAIWALINSAEFALNQ